MKQISKQSLKELIKFALDMPVGDLAKYGTLFSSQPVPETMSRGELIAVQLIQRASMGDMDAIRELRYWTVEDPKNSGGGTTNYYQFLLQLAGGQPVAVEATEGLRKMVKEIEVKIGEVLPPANDLLDELS